MTSKSISPRVRTLTLKTATSKQIQFWNSPNRFRLFVGGRGSGKTFAGVLEALRQPKGTIGMITSPTYTMLEDGPIRTMLNIVEKAGVLEDYHSTKHIAQLTGGRTILFRSADKPDNLRGSNLDWIFFDEAAYISEQVWQTVLPTLRGSPGRAWLGTTPKGTQNWIYRTFVQSQEEDDDYAIIKSATTDNIYLPEYYVKSLKRALPSILYNQEVEGDFIDPIGQLFQPGWFDIVDYGPPEQVQWYRYWDLATSIKKSADFTASVKVALHNGIIYIDGGIHVKAEWPEVRKLIIDTMKTEPTVHVGIETAMHGLAAVQEMRRLPELTGITFRGIHVEKDKITRAMPWAARAEEGKVALVNGSWCRKFMDEALLFPSGDHDDYIDAVSGAVAMLSKTPIKWEFL